MIEIRNISKTYKKGNYSLIALADIDFDIIRGDFCTIIGPSGAGKSTLLHAIGGLIHPDNGKILYKGQNIYDYNLRSLDLYRKKNIGFMFQQFHLMPYLSVIDNIKLSCYNKKQITNIDYYLEKCSLTAMKNKFPSELSVGEKQRTAFIRAIVSSPELLLADEPTGNLDPGNSSILISLIKEFHEKDGTVMIVTHDSQFSRFANKKIYLDKGKLVTGQ